MSPTAVIRSEWIKIRTVRAGAGSLIAIPLAALVVTLLLFAATGEEGASDLGTDPLFTAFYGLNFGQLAAISFGTTALASEFASGALRVSLTAVPRRGLLYASKIGVVGALALGAGLLTSLGCLLVGQAFVGEDAVTPTNPGAARAVLGGGVYLALMALFAAGLTALLRSGVAVLSLLVPLVLIVPFVVGDIAGGAVEYLPDRAGQVILHAAPAGGLGPWEGLAVTALWAAAAVLAGWWSLRRRDA